MLKNDITIRAEWNDDYYSYPPSYDLLHYNILAEQDGRTAEQVPVDLRGSRDRMVSVVFQIQLISDICCCIQEIKIDGAIPFEDMEEYCFLIPTVGF